MLIEEFETIQLSPLKFPTQGMSPLQSPYASNPEDCLDVSDQLHL
jgi:hypothetical protein